MKFQKLHEMKIFTAGIALIAGIIAGSFTFGSIPALDWPINRPSLSLFKKRHLLSLKSINMERHTVLFR